MLLLGLASCDTTNPNWKADSNLAEPIHESMQKVTDVIVHDIFSPPQAARIYAYTSVAAYEAGRYESQFRDLKMPEDVFDRSVAFGEAVSKAVLAWADTDNYKQSRTFPKFSITSEVQRWRPTPPDYMDGIEPHWLTIRPFLLDSSQQFKPLAPPAFDLTEGSKFHTDLLEVYNALDEDTENRVEVASFWDCNPFVSHHRGHVMFATKKISPGGHWMGIAKTVGKSQDVSAAAALEMYLRVSISLADGFISCWDEKYRSNLVRPETLINQYIDEDWQPALQTPPFPEYTSGHSVISRAAAVAMTGLFGENFAYTDSVEVDWGLAAREYDSFFKASEEAAVSRLYGGIHYGPAIWEGVKQGEQVGEFVKRKLVTRNKKMSKLQTK